MIGPVAAPADGLATDRSGDKDLSGVIVETSQGEAKRFIWDFGRRNDQDYDGWPDGWKRYQGPGYPRYLQIAIAPHDPEFDRKLLALDAMTAQAYRWVNQRWPGRRWPLPPSWSDLGSDRYLRIDLDGGLAMVQSGAVPTGRLYQYRFRARVMTAGLKHNSVSVALVFLDAAGTPLASHATPPIGGTTDWTNREVDRIRPPEGARSMVVRLTVEGSEDGLEDIRGAIGLDDVVIEKFPQLSLVTDEKLGLYPPGRRPRATATVLGLPSITSEALFELRDVDGALLASRSEPIRAGSGSRRVTVAGPTGGAIRGERVIRGERSSRGEPMNRGEAVTGGTSGGQGGSIDAEVDWQLPPLSAGFYRLSVSLEDEEGQRLVAQTTLAVIENLVAGPAHGVFGWTLPHGLAGPDGAHPIDPRQLAPWLESLGVAWVKLPCWISPDDDAAAERIASALSRLQDYGIQTVGMLDEPPESELERYDVRGRRIPHIAELLRDPEIWQPLLEPVMSRLTLKVKLWQLGADGDHSFLGRTRLDESIRDIARGLQGFGQPIDVAINWPWMEAHPAPDQTSWQAVSRGSQPPLTADELDAFLRRQQSDEESHHPGVGPRTWLLLQPTAVDDYPRDQRVRDLLLRMAATRKHQVQAVFVADPHDPDRGLLRPDGRPDEMLLPWRTTSRLIGNLRHLGSVRLRTGAENAVFVGEQRAVMMVWSAAPTEELLFLGGGARHVDAWGRAIELPLESYGGHPVHRVAIGPTPTFLIDIDPTLAAFRMSVELLPEHLDSLLGARQRLSIGFRNPGPETLSGEVQIRAPESWEIRGETPYWELQRGRYAEQPFDVVLGNSTSVGQYELPLRFRLQTTPPQEITVYRQIQIGPQGLDIQVRTRLLPGGDLELRLQMTNESDEDLAYDCLVFPGPGRQYDRRIVGIEAGQTEVRLFRWADGRSLIGGTILIRATERDGRRVLNYAIEAKP